MRRYRQSFLAMCGLIAAASIGKAQPANPTLPGKYDPNNDYARAARGEVKVALLYQDRYAMAYLAHTPFTEGHFIVVSKQSTARNFMEVDPQDLAHMWAVAKIVAKAEIVALGADGFIVRSNAGSAGATAQFHIHIITRKTGVPMDESRPERTTEQLEPLAAKIRAAIN
jgi:histidine triad (HIT) family protein